MSQAHHHDRYIDGKKPSGQQRDDELPTHKEEQRTDKQAQADEPDGSQARPPGDSPVPIAQVIAHS